MKRRILRTNTFVRSAKHAIKKHPDATGDLREALHLLAEDAFNPKLRTHKLKGKLMGFWACSAGIDLRIVFEFVEDEGSEAILLETIGTHDEVY
ncbi:MAG: type II toxin-antitoxin system mRNA interferase toxin, RelE/StbE family [Anaerolineales bacterium]|nr:type II toxin-antitoxin system mRNA interferase toxin, RelE/StbE family [Anaerolineales bacterium]